MLKNLIHLFFPPVCSGCHSFLLSNETVICTNCRHHLPQTHHHLQTENEAFKKFYGRIPVIHASAFLYFHKKGMVQELIHNLKYRGHQEIGTQLGYWYAEELKNNAFIKSVDAIIPVPIHKKRRHKRGYNQVDTFANALSNVLNIPVENHILLRKIDSKTQSKKNLLGRMEGIDQVFDVVFEEKEHNKHFLLLDDVLTTGATLESCSRALLTIPGAKISIVCMAMAHS
ncbi:ComF family protein [Flavobacterium succinicans]|uniref:DNA utilization protein GntX n=1 Tax=Flavobacterium succinicans TaxID=29536 RepID=A0A199XPY5_9FLAO|nr:ComF family protein [Flavobacterium succinicans]OAZ03705.1 DNA utilization protein GntX [Flavobacterium succinicans]